MDQSTILSTVLNSTSDDWEVVGGWYPTDAEYHSRAVYTPDTSIALTWGRTIVEDFKEEWANGFPDESASSFWVLILLHGQPVYDDFLVQVDGGRAYLPPPSVGAMSVPRERYQLARLLDEVEERSSEFDSYFIRSGLKLE